jgi:hypothetical protein
MVVCVIFGYTIQTGDEMSQRLAIRSILFADFFAHLKFFNIREVASYKRGGRKMKEAASEQILIRENSFNKLSRRYPGYICQYKKSTGDQENR